MQDVYLLQPKWVTKKGQETLILIKIAFFFKTYFLFYRNDYSTVLFGNIYTIVFNVYFSIRYNEFEKVYISRYVFM